MCIPSATFAAMYLINTNTEHNNDTHHKINISLTTTNIVIKSLYLFGNFRAQININDGEWD